MKFFKSMKLFFIAILIIGIATPLSTEAATVKSGDLMNINKTVSKSTLVKGETTDVTLTVKGTPKDSTFVKPNDVILIVDKSGSMQSDNRLVAAKEATKEFIELMDLTKHEVGIVDFAADVDSFPLTTDKIAAKSYVDTIQLAGNTNTGAAIRQATSMLANKRPNVQPTIVIMTDGAANSAPDALAAAKAAKDAGITFYSIALLAPNENPDTSSPNNLLKEMASSFDHHHFVLGSVGLSDVYKAIVEEIGLASAYNVTITDTISPEFELVPGSYDHHIPKPTVTGNTIEWSISELKTKQLSFTYQVRAKDNANVGKYTLAKTSSTFEIGDGSTYSLNSTNPIVEIKNHAPVITSITEQKGLATGGETVTITGQNFLPGANVLFHTKPATILSESATELVVVTPPGSFGPVAVKVVNPDNQTATGDFFYLANPTITSITPAEGPLKGGTVVTITGTEFIKGATVFFNDVELNAVVANPTTIRLTTPEAVTPGSVTVKVVNPDKTTAELIDGYAYSAPPPPPAIELNMLNIISGPLAGGNSVLLNGKNIDKDVRVFFGDKEVAVDYYMSHYQIRVIAPEGVSAGSVTVKAINPDNTSAELVKAYEYIAPPPPPVVEIDSLSVTSGLVNGGNSIYIQGKNFNPKVKIFFGDQEAKSVTYSTSSRIRVSVPEAAGIGVVSVKAENPDGTSATLEDAYEYIAPILPPGPEIVTLSENSALTGQSKLIKITGNNFASSTKVFFGDQEVTTSYLSKTSLNVRYPASQVEGSVDVTVRNIDNQEAVLLNGFTYIAPVPEPAPIITTLSSNAGPVSGNETITITGQNFQKGALVYFNDRVAQVLSVTETEIQVVTPTASSTGFVSVKVINSDQQEGIVLDAYLYEGLKPTITSLSQDSGAAKGNYLITINGTNFSSSKTKMSVKVDGQEVSYTYSSKTKISVRMPAHAAGTVYITINLEGELVTVPFMYY